MRTRSSQLFSFMRRGSVTRFLTAAVATSALALAQTTPGTTSAPTRLPPVDSSVTKVPEAVLKTADAPDPSATWLRISGNTVNVRARPDVNSLSMTRLERDTIVWGLKKESGWWAISPPPDVFSLIAARFVEHTGADRGIIKVEPGSTLRVRAGSCNVQVNPQETDVQARIGNGQEVRIMGDVTSGTAPDGTPERWLKIAPPDGVAAYISVEYAEPISEDVARARGATKPGMTIAATSGALRPTEPASPTTAAPTPPAASATPPTISTPASDTAIIPAADGGVVSSSPWARRLREIEAEVEQESKKPAPEQSWTRALGELRQIAEQREDAGSATEAQKLFTKLEETSRSAGNATSATPANTTPGSTAGSTTTTIIPVTLPSGESSSSTAPSSSVPMEPSRAETSDTAAFDIEGVLRPSWKIPAGQFGLRYKLCNPTNPNLVRGYAEFPFDLGISPTQYIGKYVGVVGDRYIDVDHEVAIYRAKRLTVLTPDRAVHRPRDQQ